MQSADDSKGLQQAAINIYSNTCNSFKARHSYTVSLVRHAPNCDLQRTWCSVSLGWRYTFHEHCAFADISGETDGVYSTSPTTKDSSVLTLAQHAWFAALSCYMVH